MGSESLTDLQRGILVRQLRRQLQYLNKLTEKMLKKQWPLEDPVRDEGIEAQKAMQRLYDAARLSGAERLWARFTTTRRVGTRRAFV